MEPYEYAAIVLPGIDIKEAIRITQKDRCESVFLAPLSTSQVHPLAATGLRSGTRHLSCRARIPGRASLDGGDASAHGSRRRRRDTAREIYQRMYEQSNDEKVKEMARRRLLQLRSFEERDGLRRLM